MYDVLLIIVTGRLAVNMLYTWLSGIFAVVKSAANFQINSEFYPVPIYRIFITKILNKSHSL